MIGKKYIRNIHHAQPAKCLIMKAQLKSVINDEPH